MEQFVIRQNILHFRHLLDRETDPAERHRIEALMAEAEADLRLQLGDKPTRPPAAV
jgi:hypothetical protein